ncbi:CheB methylesterase domain-containing protein [Blastomonas sp.]|uniref:CheB methylesterase domain-containing protein n=2 Tax=unclassified Blastomonas TaxID=2626550 RepID=UPI00406A2C57
MPETGFRWNGAMVAIAASTGGVEAIQRIVTGFPADCPPTLIVQHMPCGITPLFADRLDRHSLPHVVEAQDGMPIRQGMVCIAPGGAQHLVVEHGPPLRCRLLDAPPVNGHRPSADCMFESLTHRPAGQVVAVVLTGMGDDGAQGLLKLRNLGMRTIAQDESSALIFGMPKVAAECGAAEQILPLDRIAERILELCQC